MLSQVNTSVIGMVSTICLLNILSSDKDINTDSQPHLEYLFSSSSSKSTILDLSLTSEVLFVSKSPEYFSNISFLNVKKKATYHI